jgi:cryptochrome
MKQTLFTSSYYIAFPVYLTYRTTRSEYPYTLFFFPPSSIIKKNGGKAPLTYHQFQTIVASMETPPPAEPTINQHFLNGTYTPIGEDHDEKYGVPTLEELG